MFFRELFSNKFSAAICAVAVYFSVLLINDGFMALDEYWVGITRYIPAQTSSVTNLVSPDDVKSPLQLLPMHAVAQVAYKLGVESPYWQYRLVIFALGIINFLFLLWAFNSFSNFSKFSANERNLLIIMFALYFAAPFALTRPMFEAVAAPWITLAAIYAFKYDIEERRSDLLWGVFFVSGAFVLRQQLGFCALVFIILPLLKRKIKDLIYAGILGGVFIILSGIPDYYLRGEFHYSLLNLTVYNFKHGSDYGNRSVLFYPALIFIVTLFPFFIKRYPKNFTKNILLKYRSFLIILALFVFLHSLFPQKWERFIISMLPILIILLHPFLYQLHTFFKDNKYRLISLYTLNFSLFVIASFFPAQKNLIEMSRYLDKHPEIKTVYKLEDVPEWITEAFILQKNFNFVSADDIDLNSVDWKDCSKSLVVADFQLVKLNPDLVQSLKFNAEFNVNLIERMAYMWNPKNNVRRVRLYLYSGCER